MGFAPTKTLAKIANHIGKKQPGGVFLLPDDPTEILASLPAGEVWGVGRRLALKLRAERIFSAKDLRDASDDVIRSVGGVVLLRAATELRGKPCNEERDYDADPDSVSCSRSFGEPVTTLDGISESLASFTAQARCSPLGTRLRSACSLPHGSRTPARGGYAEGIGERSWKMKRSKLSKRASTRWDELMVVR